MAAHYLRLTHSSFFTLHLTRSDSGGIQTHNLLIRSQMLYSVELRSLFLICGCKGTHFFSNYQIFSHFFSFLGKKSGNLR